MPGPESPEPRAPEEDVDTGFEEQDPEVEQIEGRVSGLGREVDEFLDKAEADLLETKESGINDDDVLEVIDQDEEEEEDALTEVLIENGMSPEEAEAWEVVKNLDFSELFGEVSGVFDSLVMNELSKKGISEEQWFKIWNASPGMKGYRETMSRGYTETDESFEPHEFLWRNASHFTVPKGYGTSVTSNPQANRGTVRNKEGEVVSRGAHKGVDLKFPIGTPLIATIACEVIDVSLNRATGMKVSIMYPDGSVASFGHLDEVHVRPGDVIGRGSVFAKTGNTGFSTGPHLHLQTYKDNKLTDPFAFLGGTGLEPKGGADDYHFPFGDHSGHDH